MKALVLSGGEIKGAWQAGVIESVLESGFQPDIITGISVGALNAAYLVANYRNDWPSLGRELTQWWETNATSPSKFIKKRKWYELVYRVVFKKWDGLVSTSPLQKMIHEMFKGKLPTRPVDDDFVPRTAVGAVNMITGTLGYTESTSPAFIEAVLASAAEPIALPLIDVYNEPHYDGGLRDIAPLKQAISMGATEIVAVVCQPAKMGSAVLNKGDIMALVNRVVGVMTNEIVQTDLERAELMNQLLAELPADVLAHPYFTNKRHLDVRVVRPAAEIGIHLDSFDHADILTMVQAGREAGHGD